MKKIRTNDWIDASPLNGYHMDIVERVLVFKSNILYDSDL